MTLFGLVPLGSWHGICVWPSFQFGRYGSLQGAPDNSFVRNQSTSRTLYCPKSVCWLYFPISLQSADYALEVPTIYFMPHCDLELYEAVLRAIWNPESISNFFLLGNQLQEYVDKWARSGYHLSRDTFADARSSLSSTLKQQTNKHTRIKSSVPFTGRWEAFRNSHHKVHDNNRIHQFLS